MCSGIVFSGTNHVPNFRDYSVLYGPRGIVAIEVKRSERVTDEMFGGLRMFMKEYPMARAYFLTAGDRDGWENGVRVMPIEAFLKNIGAELAEDDLK